MSCANNPMHTSLCLQIVTTCVYLACHFSKVEAINGDWKKILGDPDVDSLASICIQICKFLVANRKASDTDTFKKIKAQLELLKLREGGAVSKSPPLLPPPHASADQPNAKQPRVG
jgi:hypothetical protein